MEQHFREHYSQNFYLNTSKIPSTFVDRASAPALVLGFIFSVLFIILGYYLLNQPDLTGAVDFEKNLAQTTINAPKFLPTHSFAWMILFVGIGMFLSALFFTLRHKVISFDGQTLTVTDYPVIGHPHSFTERIHEYVGVRLRTKFSQHGFFSRNKFILELYHKDPSKIIPLYISRSPKKVRTFWKAYATLFELMPIHITEQGMVSHRISDLDTDFQEVIKKWNLPKDFINDKTHSDLLIFRRRQNTQMIQMRRPVFDAYSTFNVLAILIFGALLSYGLYHHFLLVLYLPLFVLVFLYILCFGFILEAFLSLLTKDMLFIHNKRLIVFRKIFRFSFKKAIIPFALIRSIDIQFTPVTERYTLKIISEDQTVTVFNKLSPNDLRYIRGYLLYEIGEMNFEK